MKLKPFENKDLTVCLTVTEDSTVEFSLMDDLTDEEIADYSICLHEVFEDSPIEDDEYREKKTKELHERFVEIYTIFAKATIEKDGVPDWPARRTAWVNWTDQICRDGEISRKFCEEIEGPTFIDDCAY